MPAAPHRSLILCVRCSGLLKGYPFTCCHIRIVRFAVTVVLAVLHEDDQPAPLLRATFEAHKYIILAATSDQRRESWMLDIAVKPRQRVRLCFFTRTCCVSLPAMAVD